MDVKRTQAVKENRLYEHPQMGVEAAKEFFKKFDLTEEFKEKVYNCILAHHGEVPFTCREAEVCANADCYKFLHPKGMLQFFGIIYGRTGDFSKVLDEAEEKLEKKHKILTLDICKQELEPYYKMFKESIQKAREA